MSAVLGPYQVAGSLWQFVLSGDQKAAEKPLSALWHILLLSYIRTEQNALGSAASWQRLSGAHQQQPSSRHNPDVSNRKDLLDERYYPTVTGPSLTTHCMSMQNMCEKNNRFWSPWSCIICSAICKDQTLPCTSTRFDANCGRCHPSK